MQPEQKISYASFDHTNPELMSQPYDMYRQFREHCPVGRSQNHGGFWFVSRYDDVVAVAKNFRTFSNRDGVGIPKHPLPTMYPLDLDPPLHTAFRNVLMPLFLKSEAEILTPAVDAEVDRLLQPLIAAGGGDLNDLCTHIPTHFALQVIGIADDTAEQLLHWVDLLTHGSRDEAESIEAGANLHRFATEIAAGRRGEARRGDVLDALLHTEVPGMGMLDDDAIARVMLVLIFGGLHTSRSAMLESLLYIGRNPAVRKNLLERIDDAPFWETAVEEFIRYSTPTQCVKRQVTQDTTLHGQTIAAGEDVLLLWGWANHDETQFANPDQVQLDRTPNLHTAFGIGAHRCIGQHLARVFIRSLIRRTLVLMPNFTIAEDFVPQYRAGEARAMTGLQVRSN